MKEYVCKHCDAVFDNHYVLGGHITAHHLIKKQCPVCEKWLNPCNYERHVESHKKEHPCPQCGTLTNNEIFCSQSCSTIHNNYMSRRVSRYCLACGKELTCDQENYCSNQCQIDWQKQERISLWLRGEWDGTTKSGKYLSQTIRNYLIESSNYSCSKCGWSEINPTTKRVPLQIDHKDGNYRNNSPKNLRVLCPNCHSLTPTFGALNKGNGREHRQ